MFGGGGGARESGHLDNLDWRVGVMAMPLGRLSSWPWCAESMKASCGPLVKLFSA